MHVIGTGERKQPGVVLGPPEHGDRGVEGPHARPKDQRRLLGATDLLDERGKLPLDEGKEALEVLQAVLAQRPVGVPAFAVGGVHAEELDLAGVDEIGHSVDHAVVLPAQA